MGMSDKQFNAFLLMLIDDLEEVKQEAESNNIEIQKLEKMIKNLKRTLEKE